MSVADGIDGGAFQAPERFGAQDRYVRVRKLGEGSFAPVWEYSDEVAGRSVAVKFLSYAHNAMPPLQEIRAVAGAHHPNLVTMYDVMEIVDDDGRPRTAMIMELITGTSLASVIRTRGRVEPRQLLEWADQIASAIDHLHRRLVHGDLHPGNVLLDEHSTRSAIKITDLGTSTRIGEPSIGRFDVQAPEASRGASGASDYWALGLLLAQLGAGKLITLTHRVGDSREVARAARAQALGLARTITHAPVVRLIEELLRVEVGDRADRSSIRKARYAQLAAAGQARPPRRRLAPALPLVGAAGLAGLAAYLAAITIAGSHP